MLTEAVIIALITAITTIFGQYLVTRKEYQKDGVKRAKREQFIDSQLSNIDQKLTEHNRYAEKFSTVEKSIIEIKKDIEYLRKDIK